MAIVKFCKELLALEPDIKDFVLSHSTEEVLNVTTAQDAIDQTEAYMIGFDGFPTSGTVVLCFMEQGRSTSPEGYTAFSGLYRNKFIGYWK